MRELVFWTLVLLAAIPLWGLLILQMIEYLK